MKSLQFNLREGEMITKFDYFHYFKSQKISLASRSESGTFPNEQLWANDVMVLR